jgi:dihydrofolate synthase/folylpolyglutamate synthase
MTYATAVSNLYALGHELHLTPVHKFDLAHMRVLVEALGNPQSRFRAVLVAGTNGKGSTCATLAAILCAAGYKTALYTSPHLVRINERIRIDGASISDADFVSAYEQAQRVSAELVADGRLPHFPSFFEMMTAMAFVHFAAAGVEIAVLEVGMGGRLDATNIVEPCLTVITDIDLDHQKYLGETIAEIAFEKAGILRAGVTAVTLPQHPQANDVLGRAMIAVGARPVSAAGNMAPVAPGSEALVSSRAGRTRFALEVLGEVIAIDSPLIGRHQLRNLALAITAAEELAANGVAITAKQIEQGIRETRWAGRFQSEAATPDRPQIIYDVAHNPGGAWALRAALNETYGERPQVIVFGAMRDKAIREMAQILFPAAEAVFVTTASHTPRAASGEEIAAIAIESGSAAEVKASVKEALDAAFAAARQLGAQGRGEPVVVIAGSIYIVGEAMEVLGVEG